MRMYLYLSVCVCIVTAQEHDSVWSLGQRLCKTATSQAVARHSRTFNARLLRLPERQEARLHNLPVILAFKVLSKWDDPRKLASLGWNSDFNPSSLIDNNLKDGYVSERAGTMRGLPVLPTGQACSHS
jgi:hypothetical protein